MAWPCAVGGGRGERWGDVAKGVGGSERERGVWGLTCTVQYSITMRRWEVDRRWMGGGREVYGSWGEGGVRSIMYGSVV